MGFFRSRYSQFKVPTRTLYKYIRFQKDRLQGSTKQSPGPEHKGQYHEWVTIKEMWELMEWKEPWLISEYGEDK